LGALILPGQLRLKVIADRRMVAFAMGEPYWRTDTSMITTIGVLPEYRRRGVGAALLERCEVLLPGAKIRLTVREDNQPALRLYEKFGYRYLSRLPQYYQDGRAGILMEKERRVGKPPEESFGRKQAD
jgi:ribosomal protein S18 acetylase RimI-like enzyme